MWEDPVREWAIWASAVRVVEHWVGWLDSDSITVRINYGAEWWITIIKGVRTPVVGWVIHLDAKVVQDIGKKFQGAEEIKVISD